MFLTGLMHRRRLFDIALRWLKNEPGPGDARVVTEIFIYEGIASIGESHGLMREAYEAVFGAPLAHQRIDYKHELREMALQAIGDPTPRQYELMGAYHENPERYFRRMPIDGSMGFTPDGRLVGTFRLKRPRRVAEKTSRRMADYLGSLIREGATELARKRAERRGVTLDELGPSPSEERAEFTRAETRLAKLFRDATIHVPDDVLHIDDLVGYKVIGTEPELARAQTFLEQHPRVHVFEREEHTGQYNAVNLLLDLELPEPGEMVDRWRDLDWSFADGRGLSPGELAAGFADYIEEGARRIRFEVILTTFDEFLESEVGRCIHEYRVLEQRYARDYTGRMAKNAEFIIEYLLGVAFSPTTSVDEIPVKMWGQYLPETLSYAIGQLHRHRASGLFLPPDLFD